MGIQIQQIPYLHPGLIPSQAVYDELVAHVRSCMELVVAADGTESMEPCTHGANGTGLPYVDPTDDQLQNNR